MRSAIYEGQLVHVRRAHAATGGVAHRFAYHVVVPYLFLDELDDVAAQHPLWSSRRPNVVWFRRADYFGDPSLPLDESVRQLVEARLGWRPGGPIALLGHLRRWGWLFNPLSVYYCFDADGVDVEAVVLEVTNTPWHDRHLYVLEASRESVRFPKQMHVSPFLPMDADYDFTWSTPGERILVRLGNTHGDERVFTASLRLARRELTPTQLGRLAWRRPLDTYGVSAGIYRQALSLAHRGAPFHPRVVAEGQTR